MSTTLINVSGNHRKFYNVKVAGKTVITQWGRIGSWMQEKRFTFASVSEAVNFALDKKYSKLNRGYVTVS
jgi:predicted DNA-binding WGR domain protein